MSTPVITPNAAPVSTPVSTPATAQPSSDRAYEAYKASAVSPSEPAKTPATEPGTPSGAPPAGAQPSAAASAASADTTAQPTAGDVPDEFADLLGADLAAEVAVAVDPNAPNAAVDTGADPLEALKDNPRVMELVANETLVKGLLTKSEYIKDPAHIEAAIVDADVLWKISEGKADPSMILEAMRNNPANTPEQFQGVIAKLRTYIEELTGQPVAAAAAGIDPNDPAAKKLAEIEGKLTESEKREKTRQQAEENTKQVARITATKTQLTANLSKSLEGTWLEGEGDYFFSLVGSKLAGKEMNVVEAAEKGDFKMVEKAIREARNEEAVRFQARVARMKALKTKNNATVPKQAAGGSPAASVEPAVAATSTDTETRRERMLKELRG
jgi:hypothetical protein